MEANVSWGLQEANSVTIGSLAEFDGLLNEIERSCGPETPTLVVVTAHGMQVTFALGASTSFVQVASETGDPPYWITASDGDTSGYEVFLLEGQHHTEVSQRHLILSKHAQELVRQILITGERPADSRWVEI